jgi:very-short-patch-repair endonuclease
MKLRRKSIGVNSRRQHPLYGFIVDFCCPEQKLIIELDGAEHAEPDSINYDAWRTALLESKGYRVLRFWNPDVLTNLEGVLEEIYGAVKKAAPPLDPPTYQKMGEGFSVTRRRSPPPYLRGEKLAGTRILLYWLTIIACAFGRNACI